MRIVQVRVLSGALSPSHSMQSGIFRKLLLHWYSLHKRELPWRDICDPYRIWISEIILQQTRIAQGLDYYERFLTRFPDVQSLAAAAEDEVLKLWEGLGYYSRARNLHAAAHEIALAGAFPTSYEGVRALKGVGDYTAAAICSFAYHQQVATVDGNVYRVLSRIFGIEVPIDTTAGKRHFKELAQQLLDPERPADFNQALMDFGSLQCTPTSPLCDDCPFRPHCVAGRSNSWQLFPVKSKRTAQQHFYFTYVIITHSGRLLIHRRGAGNIWQGLYEPYLIASTDGPTRPEADPWVKGLLQQSGSRLHLLESNYKHILTHRIIHADFYRIDLSDTIKEECLSIPENYFFATREQAFQYAFPQLIRLEKYLTD